MRALWEIIHKENKFSFQWSKTVSLFMYNFTLDSHTSFRTDYILPNSSMMAMGRWSVRTFNALQRTNQWKYSQIRLCLRLLCKDNSASVVFILFLLRWEIRKAKRENLVLNFSGCVHIGSYFKAFSCRDWTWKHINPPLLSLDLWLRS